MAGSKKIPRWQKVAYSKFNEALKSPDFKNDLEQCRKLFEERFVDQHIMAMGLVRKYNLPRGSYILIRHYMSYDGEIAPEAALPAPIVLLSEKDGYIGPDYTGIPYDEYLAGYPNTHVYLDLTGEIQKQDLLDFINENWKLIESKLKLVEPARPGAVKEKQLDKLHLRVLLLKEQDKKSYREIAAITNLTEANIKQILYRLRKHRRVDKHK